MKKILKRILTLALVLTMTVGILSTNVSAAGNPYTGSELPYTGTITSIDAYRSIVALQKEYYEGRPWTNADSYIWRPSSWFTVYLGGCAAFAGICSDAAFGDIAGDYPLRGYALTGSLPSYVNPSTDTFSYDTLRAGDILRTYGDSHSVVVLERYSDHVVVCEGNYNSSIHWGRHISKEEVLRSAYIITRYPEKNQPAVITLQPVSITAALGSRATFGINAKNARAYRWQYYDGTAWQNVPESFSGYNSYTLALKATASRNGWKFRCKVKGTDGVWVKSSTAVLKVTAPAVIKTQPSSVTAVKGNTARFAVSASNAVAYRWQYNDGSGWANLPEYFSGHNTNVLKFKATASRNGWRLRCKIKGLDGAWIKTSTVKLTVKSS